MSHDPDDPDDQGVLGRVLGFVAILIGMALLLMPGNSLGLVLVQLGADRQAYDEIYLAIRQYILGAALMVAGAVFAAGR